MAAERVFLSLSLAEETLAVTVLFRSTVAEIWCSATVRSFEAIDSGEISGIPPPPRSGAPLSVPRPRPSIRRKQ
ncbi:unnamed protein product [Linum trigynum]|uniref:Secreted protein n=1 Tax=Linum trigynum TaxID=586398 RepID=A0AAV2CXY8_9ROSI